MRWTFAAENYGRGFRGFWFGPFRIMWHGVPAFFWRPRYQNSWAEGRIISIAWLGFEFNWSYLHSRGIRFSD